MPNPARRRKAAWEDMMKQAIFEATVAVIDKHGPGGVRMDRVAKAAEMATGTLYNYFKDKDALLLHVRDTLFGPYHAELRKIVGSNLSPPEKLKAYFHWTFRRVNEQRDILTILIQAQDLTLKSDKGRNPRMDYRMTIVRLICVIIEEGIAKGAFRRYEALETASMIVGAVSGLIDSKIMGQSPERTVKEDVEHCKALIFPGLLAAS